MSFVKNKTKSEILEEMAGTAQPGSQIHEQQKAAIEELNNRISSLESSFNESSKLSGRVALGLNVLTTALVLVGIAQVVVAYIK